ncbi:ArsR/SmtB family transcription factor [Chroococcidiopsis thermalis]|uniref:Transcriptional regulator, ArsR family n=1 Tax=Chroococcidiopsis thermalis (strain PCC 7203) TaxID=251229 RepID=K9UA12_CHRTP|nr:metalloregulator ArsR/SmtB family transcription factor [Chroococcidiopsis thermalis]AFY91084.1 transcriptional regulator, ArsR family [Chroococcidiopsis thermalis PCC 7203]
MLKPSPQALTPVAEFFKVLSEVSRLQVLCSLKSGAKNVTEIIAATGLGQANVSKQLKMLTQAGMVVRRPKGISVFYEISEPIVFELCEIVCVDAKRLVVRHRLAVGLEEQTQQLEELQNLRDR